MDLILLLIKGFSTIALVDLEIQTTWYWPQTCTVNYLILNKQQTVKKCKWTYIIWSRINDSRSFVSWCIKETNKTTLGKGFISSFDAP